VKVNQTPPATAARSALRRLSKYALIAVVVLLVAGIVAPLVSVGKYGRKIKEALEASLGRRVEIGKVHYTLFSGPGFSLDDVTIEENPRFGIEPCAYVPTLEARVRLDKLLLGKIQFSSLRLVDPILNAVKRSDGSWNAIELIDRLSTPGSGPRRSLPAFEVSDGRINFKFGNRKSTFYVDGSDFSVSPEAGGKLRIGFEGSPSRSDRPGHGFGTLRGDANWYLRPATPESNQLEADLTLDRSNLSDITALVEGYDIGIHGYVNSHAVVSGPADDLKIRGNLHLEDVHRWDLMPSSGEDWEVRYRGALDLAGNRLELDTLPTDPSQPSPVLLHVRVRDLLRAPGWAIVAQFKNAPAGKLLPLVRRMGLGIPDGMTITGASNGAVGYSNRHGWNGALEFSGLTATLPDLAPLKASEAVVSVEGGQIHFAPVTLDTDFGGKLEASGDYFPDTRRVAAVLNVSDTPVDDLSRMLEPWLTTPPILPAFSKGTITGRLQYQHESPDDPAWTAQFQLENAQFQPPGLAVPLKQLSGHFALSGSDVTVTRLSAKAGDRLVTGDYRYNTGPGRTERVHLKLDAADISEVQQAFAPALRPSGFLARFRFGRRSLPAWLTARNLEADVAVSKFSVDGSALGALRAHVIWIGPSVQLSSLNVQLPGGVIEARGSIALGGATPRYRLAGDVSGFPWNDGVISASGHLDSSGTGADTLLNLRAAGAFDGSDLYLSPDAVFDNLSGHFRLSFEAGWPQLALSDIEAAQGGEQWQGSAASGPDGSIIFNLASGDRQIHVASSLLPPPPGVRPVATSAEK
jgi:AsmA protein